MTDSPQTPAALAALADHLAARRGAILQAWRDAVENDPELTTAAALSRSQFFDHIPAVLDDFAAELRGGSPKQLTDPVEADEGAAAHGLHRWQQGYRLREVTREWGHLHLVLLAELEAYAAGHPEHAAGLPAARRALARLCHAGVSHSADQYYHMRQLEAAGQVRDLEDALKRWAALERQQAELWREAAHDLRGRLGTVRNVSAVLKLPDIPEATREQSLSMLDRGVTALHALLEDVANLARLQAGHERRQAEPTDAAALLRDLCDGHEPQARERGLYLKADGPVALLVEADAVKVARVVQNLVLNALKYTRHGGVRVTWGDSRDDDPERWLISVQDTGPGLPAGAAAPLTAALETATQQAEQVEGASGPPVPGPAAAAPRRGDAAPGEGIGLSIVKRLCELLDASLEVETRPGAGTTFRVRLPRRYQ